jgi:hypothetical protein
LRWRPIMLAVLISAALVLAQAEATQPIQSGPCSVELAQIERHVAQSKSNPLEGPTASQTVGAQLHHQPTSRSVQRAERKADADFQAALAQAREANAKGDAAACAKALKRARQLYGIL